MILHRGIVQTSLDPGLDCTIWAKIGDRTSAVAVTYLSPISTLSTGFFAPPPQGSEIYILESTRLTNPNEINGHMHYTEEKEYIYLGSVVGKQRAFGKNVDENKLDKDVTESTNPKADEDTSDVPDEAATMGAPESQGPHGLPRDARRAYDGKDIVPEQQVWSSPGGHFLKFSDQSKFGRGEGYLNHFAQFATGQGKSIKMWDVPAQNMIEISPGDGLLDRIYFAGVQDTPSSEGHTFCQGELRVDTGGPIRLMSGSSRIALDVFEGFNIEVWNRSTGFMNPNFEEVGSDPILRVGGGDAYYPLDNLEADAYAPLPFASLFSEGQLHEDPAPSLTGGNPLDKGNEEYGCINVTSEWNNINLGAFGPDSVIHINAPYSLGKIVVTTGGTVDIVATQKVSITSGVKIELNAPFIDLNSGIRVDID